LLIVVGLLAVACVIALGALRLILPHTVLRSRAERELTSLLGQPVVIGGLSISLFPRPAAVGRNITIGPGGADSSTVTLERLRLVPHLRSLLGDHVVIDEVILDGLHVVVHRDADGSWRLPVAIAPVPGATRAAAGRRLTLGDVRIRQATLRVVHAGVGPQDPRAEATVDAIDAVLEDAGTEIAVTSLGARLGTTTVTGKGRAGPAGLALELVVGPLGQEEMPRVFALAGAEPPAGLALTGAQPLALMLRVSPTGTVTATGTVAAERLELGRLAATQVAAPLRMDPGAVVLDPLTLAAYGGTFSGAFLLDRRVTPAVWRVHGALEDVDAGALLAAVASGSQALSGRGRVTVDLRGRVGTSVAEGMGSTIGLRIVNGVLRDFPLLAALDQALDITESTGNDTAFDQLSATATVTGTHVRSDDLRLVAREVTVVGRGEMRPDGRLNVDARAIFSADKSRQLIRSVRELSGLRNRNGEIELPFDIGGTAAQPQFQIDVGSILGRSLTKEIERRIQRFIRPRR
jgi:uncharacterized protein involved in outer membrane biogenesis